MEWLLLQGMDLQDMRYLCLGMLALRYVCVLNPQVLLSSLELSSMAESSCSMAESL
jgi:hypothetical protein